jgi:hypothetical protein
MEATTSEKEAISINIVIVNKSGETWFSADHDMSEKYA